jgi:hypothetical protein
LPDREPPELHADVLLEALARHNVRFVTVGGFAGQLHGASRLTKDLDICPAWERENLERLASALQEVDAVLRLRPELEPATVRPNAELLREISITLWRTSAGDLEVLIGIPNAPGRVAGFRELNERATELQLHDGTVLVAAIEDLIRSKEIADRPKDREALPELRALRDARRGQSTREPQTQQRTTSERPPPTPSAPSRLPPERYPPHRGPTLER